MQTTTVYPLLYNETLSEDDLEKAECSNGIYVSNSQFRGFYSDANEELVILKLSRGHRSIYAHIASVHHGEEHMTFIPAWMTYELGCDGDGGAVEIERAHPSIGTSISIKPHTSEYADGDDPVTVLQHAFESYSCLSQGSVVPLRIGDLRVYVTIMETNSDGPICIRGVELEVKIDIPLDAPDEGHPGTPIPPEPALFAPEPALFAPDPRFPGSGQRLGSA